MRRTLMAVGLSVLLSQSAFGGYIENYAGWRALSAGQKAGYAMGAYDGGHATFSEGDPYGEVNSRGILSCGQQLKLDSGMLVELIDTNYAKSPDNWGLSPSQVLTTGLFAMCKAYINNFRRAKGLDLLK
jgi:hypothetical protein